MRQVFFAIAATVSVAGQTIANSSLVFAAPPANARVLVTNLTDPAFPGYTPEPIISPDGKKVAYISSGALFVCNVSGGSPKELAKVPGTLSAILTESQYSQHRQNPQKLQEIVASKEFMNDVLPRARGFCTGGFGWTPSSDGVFLILRGDTTAKAETTVMYVSLDEMTSQETELKLNARARKNLRDINHYELVRDGELLLMNGMRGGALYELATKSFREPFFTQLVASRDGQRFLGLDSSRQQLVLLDDQLRSMQHFDFPMPNVPDRCELTWSPDERSILWRSQIANDDLGRWQGFRMDLISGEKRDLSGSYFREQFHFTGNGSELICGGYAVNDASKEARSVEGLYLTLIPPGAGAPRDIYRITNEDRRLPAGGPLLIVGPKGRYFAFALPRKGQDKPLGWIWHLIDREGKKWRLPGDEADEFQSPYDLLGFANEANCLVARWETQIFTIPIPQDW